MIKNKDIIIENLSQIKDKTKILDNINFNIPINKVVCLVGPSGCGKTSLLRAIAGLDEIDSGKIFFNNQLMSKLNFSVPVENRNIGLVFQEANLFPHLNVFKNVSFGSKKKKFKEVQEDTYDILKKIGLPHLSNIFPHQLSGGQKQLVAIARSLITKPKLIMMDEPFANLDQRLKTKIRDITLHLLQKTRTTALIVTHDPEDAMFMGDFIAVMNKGRILQFDTPINIYNKPNSAFVARFFGESFTLKSKVKNKAAKTMFGDINLKNISGLNSSDIEIVFRSEAFTITRNNSNKSSKKIKTRVIAVKYISENSYLHLDLLGNHAQKHIHIRVPGKFIPPKNKICYININKNNFFIFNKLK